ncbi:MAG: cytochrome b/b6 domain-containing protein [Rhodobacteraceae bacterium]|jgi:cytochrome b561|nr:cytochrome b/b6 domain-containing protein [Paracoccaceae bacterium]
MSSANTATSYGAVARTLHWLTALLILTAIPLGWYANELPYATGEELAAKAQLFSLHKTVGMAAFAVALIRILWALTQARPEPMHPDRRFETLAAEGVHWALYLSLVIVPLSGWVHHAATDGFAPILWPFGQDLPGVPTSETVAHLAGAMHWVFTKVLILSILLHVAGALKHVFIDRDHTLARMTRGVAAPARATGAAHARGPALAAVAIYAAGAGLAWSMAGTTAPEALAQTASTEVATTGNWLVTEGTLGFAINQMGSTVQGTFASWTADITFTEEAVDGSHGNVTVTIDIASLTLGSITDQAKGPDFFDATTHPTATFTANILPAAEGYIADGTLTLRGVTAPLQLPFALSITGDTASMTGTTTIDRRTFGMGQTYGDESTVGFNATVTTTLTATRK